LGRIDLLIRDADFEPFIVVETKISPTKELTILDISVRQTHQYSTAVKAPYFVITNGSEFHWFETGSTGRPNETDPIQYEIIEDKKTIKREAEFALASLRNLRNLAMHSGTSLSYTYPNEAVYFIMLKLIAEREYHGQIDNNVISTYQNKFPHLENISPEGLWKAADILRGVNFSKLPKYQLLDTIEQALLFDKQYMGQFDLPKWLSTFMVKLSDLEGGDCVLNLNVGLGRILAAISIEAQGFDEITLSGQEKNQYFGLWSVLPSYIFANSMPHMLWENIHFLREKYSKVLCAPPFGGRISSQEKDSISYSLIFSDIRVRNSETDYLISAIESAKKGGVIVFLVPQGFLFRGSYEKRIRQVILEHTTLKAIIGMPSKTLAPYTTIKTSILVIEKTPPEKTNHVLIGNIDEIPKINEFAIQLDSQMQLILDAYQENKLNQDNKPLFTYVTSEEIKNNDFDFTPTRYSQGIISIPEEFDLITLKNLTIRVTRGKPIRISEPGKSKVLTSAAIRTLSINSEEIKLVDLSQIPQDAVHLEEGDIVINAVGTYLGNAAIVSTEVAGLPINQHVIVIKPDRNQIDPEYLALVFNSDFIQTKFQHGGVIPSLNLTQVRSALIPVPPISIQKELVDKYKQIQTELKKAIEKTENLRNRFEDFISTLKFGEEK